MQRSDKERLSGQPDQWLWEPQRVRGSRILRQSSVFIFGNPEIPYRNIYEEIIIAAD